jgi:hypothetical protein
VRSRSNSKSDVLEDFRRTGSKDSSSSRGTGLNCDNAVVVYQWNRQGIFKCRDGSVI